MNRAEKPAAYVFKPVKKTSSRANSKDKEQPIQNMPISGMINFERMQQKLATQGSKSSLHGKTHRASFNEGADS